MCLFVCMCVCPYNSSNCGLNLMLFFFQWIAKIQLWRYMIITALRSLNSVPGECAGSRASARGAASSARRPRWASGPRWRRPRCCGARTRTAAWTRTPGGLLLKWNCYVKVLLFLADYAISLILSLALVWTTCQTAPLNIHQTFLTYQPHFRQKSLLPQNWAAFGRMSFEMTISYARNTKHWQNIQYILT